MIVPRPTVTTGAFVVALAACFAAGCAMGEVSSARDGADAARATADGASPRDAATTSRPPYGARDASSTTAPPVDTGTPPIEPVDDGGGSATPMPTGDDASAPPVDPPDAAGPSDPAYGECGRSTYDCACMCGGDPRCVDTCIAGSPACVDCFHRADATCCPMEAAGVTACATAAGCTDDACVAARCRAPLQLLQQCVSAGGDDPTACGSAQDACTGTTSCM